MKMLWESSQEDNSHIMDFISLPQDMADNTGLDESMKGSDEISLFGNGSPTHLRLMRMFDSPQAMTRLLSPEQSPQNIAKNMEKALFMKKEHFKNIELKNAGVTPKKSLRYFNSLSSCSMGSSNMDEDYMELYDMETCDLQTSGAADMLPSNMSNLIKGQMVINTPTPVKRSPESDGSIENIMHRPTVRRCLSLNENLPKTPEQQYGQKLTLTPSGGFKRPEPPTNNLATMQNKRLRNDEKENENEIKMARPILRKSMSADDNIFSALSRSESGVNLIGDFSKPFVLPIMEKGNHTDLKSISSDTVARLLKGEFSQVVKSFKIIDCRYPYEYEGGHIIGAKNIYTPDQILQEFLNETEMKTDTMETLDDLRRNIIIFHCEFSSERGPKLSRYLRNADRNRNTATYPTLNHPEIYLLHNGYKEFFETHGELCEPNAYRPMLSPGYGDELRHFRAKSKSWNCDGAMSTARHKKSRSRLIL